MVLTSDPNPTDDGAVSVDGGDVFLGNGSGKDRIGTIDATEDGTGGKDLVVQFSSPLTNSGFESADASGWTIFEERYPNNLPTTTDYFYNNGDCEGTDANFNLATQDGMSYSSDVQGSTVGDGNYSLKLESNGTIDFNNNEPSSCPNSSTDFEGYGSDVGPYAVSEPFEAKAGDDLSVMFSAQEGSDSYDVFGFLVDVGSDGTYGTSDDSRQKTLFSERGATRGWTTKSSEISEGGTYAFEFVSGTYDQTGGFAVGATLFIDDARLIPATTTDDAVVQTIIEQITYKNGSDDPDTSTRTLNITATDTDGNEGSGALDISLTAVNDAPTMAAGSSTSLTVDEDASATSLSSKLEVDDPDSGQTLTWTVVSAPSNGTLSGFSTTASSGTGVQPSGVTYAPNADVSGSGSFDIQVADGNGGTATIAVNVTINNLAPAFNSASSTSFAENGTGTALDVNADDGGDGTDDDGVDYTITGGADGGEFTLDTSTGELSFTSAPDFENPTDGDTNNEYVVEVTADDRKPSNNTTAQTITVDVTDVNEAPAVSLGPSSGSIDENNSPPNAVTAITIEDDPAGSNTLSLSGADSGAFTINGSNELEFTDAADFESKSSYDVTVEVNDPGVGSDPDDSQGFSLSINDTSPTIANQTVGSVGEDASSGATVGTVKTGGDTQPTTFSITINPDPDGDGTGAFAIDGSTGEVTVADGGDLDFDQNPSLDMTAQVTDGNSSPTATVTVDLNDVNLAPAIALGQSSESLDENNGPPNAVTAITVEDDASGSNTLSLSGADASAFQIDGSDLQFTETADFEQKSSYAVTVEVNDPGVGSDPDDSQGFTLSINDVDEAPTVTTNQPLSLEEGTSATVPQGLLEVTDPESGPAGLTYTIDNDVTTGHLYDTNASARLDHGDTFTQADVNSGHIAYQHDGSETTADAFDFTVADGGGASALDSPRTFSISITSVNDAPAISNIEDQRSREDERLEAGLELSDPDTAPEDLTFTSQSSNSDLVPTDSIHVDGEGASRTVAIVPRADSSGTAKIRIIADDGQAQDTTAFALTIEPVNDAPRVQMALSDKTLRPDGPPLWMAGMAEATFRDPEGDPITVQAHPRERSVVQGRDLGPGAIGLRPVGTGTAKVQVVASDGEKETATFFQATVETQEGEAPVAHAQTITASPSDGERINIGPRASGEEDAEHLGLSVVAQNATGEGAVGARRFESGPADPSGIASGNVSEYRFVLGADPALQFGAGTEVRLATWALPGLEDPSSATVYKRAEEGEAFTGLSTSVEERASGTELVARLGEGSAAAESSTAGGAKSSSGQQAVLGGEYVLVSRADPLPVELASLEAESAGDEVQLRWQTASETGSAGFYVERRRGGRNTGSAEDPAQEGWTEVGFVASKAPGGTTTEPKRYRFTDPDVPFGADSLGYRLRQVDTDGSVHHSKPVALERGAAETVLKAPFPSPARQQATLRYALPKTLQGQTVEVVLYDVMGRRVRTIVQGQPDPGRTKTRVDVSGLSSGTYFLRLRAGDAARTRRLVVVR